MAEYRVVVAEADAAVRALIVAQVEQLGHSVVAEAAEPEALLLLAEAHLPDVIVVDWWLPGPDDALPAVQKLLRRYPALRIVAIVDKQRNDDRRSALATGVWVCLPTPHTTMEMMSALEAPRPTTVQHAAPPRSVPQPEPVAMPADEPVAVPRTSLGSDDSGPLGPSPLVDDLNLSRGDSGSLANAAMNRASKAGMFKRVI